MALRQVVLSRRIADNRAALEPLLAKRDELAGKKAGMQAREAELEAAVNEVTEETTPEDRDALNQAVDEFEAEAGALDGEIADNEKAIGELETAIGKLESELDEINKKAETPTDDPQTPAEDHKRSVNTMETRVNIPAMTLRDRVAAIVTRDDVKNFLTEMRSAIAEKRALTGVGKTIPVVMLPLLRAEVARGSKLLPYMNVQRVGGTARQNILGSIPEAVWTEMCANLNELDLGFNQIEVDGFKVAGFMAICNAAMEDSDEDLAAEVITAIGGAIGKGLDKAILFGTGTKMPLGIATRLAQTSEPANWSGDAPAWTDLHASNVLSINAQSSSGAAFFIALVEKLAVAKPKYTSDGLFWAMNRKTHMDIMAKALAFNSNAALVSNTNLMPVVGGDVIEFEDDELADYEIIGGFGGNYLLAERAGVAFARSEHVRFLQDQTVFKGTARYDGKPAAGEAFVIVNYNNAAPTTSADFPEDYANTPINDLVITAAAGSANGKTVLTVSGTLAQSNPTLKYKLGVYDFDYAGSVVPSGFAALTSGTTQITAAAGKKITVVELDSDGRVVSCGVIDSVPKTAE